MSAGNGLEFLNAGQFTFEGPLTFEGIAVNHLDGTVSSIRAASQPNFSVTAAADPAQQLVIGNHRRNGMIRNAARDFRRFRCGPGVHLCKSVDITSFFSPAL